MDPLRRLNRPAGRANVWEGTGRLPATLFPRLHFPVLQFMRGLAVSQAIGRQRCGRDATGCPGVDFVQRA